ncbi:endonuclease/exonuclease/phosphatase family protein [Kitasatospora griseola]|uniref:endonuclease/exonuclease/phosphatase family protein n=1 Tax=Kitasatospora griseola TaxID=2064 RepID=UPI000695CC75|nr:endonuclease/exonuclease/phosphatase family protein [Kitasatospora griseola]
MELKVMTYNLKFDDEGSAASNSWTTRRPIMASLLKAELPHLLGTQEGLYNQLKQIHQDLSAQEKRRYAWLGEGREGGSHSEFMAIFYDSERLVPQEYEHFWIYEADPLTIGKRWDANSGSPRMVTWVRFRDTATQGEFYAVNTHADDQSEMSRQASAAMIRARMNNTLKRQPPLPRFDPNLPCIVTGDFNTIARKGEKAYDILVGDGRLVDTWVTAKKRGQVYATWNDWRAPRMVDERLDWILTTPKVQVGSTSIITYQEKGQWPSDHCPVQATMTLQSS